MPAAEVMGYEISIYLEIYRNFTNLYQISDFFVPAEAVIGYEISIYLEIYCIFEVYTLNFCIWKASRDGKQQ